MFILVRNRLKIKDCIAEPDFVKAQPPNIDQYNSGGDKIQNVIGENIYQDFATRAQPIAKWLEIFGSEDLNNTVA